MHINAGGMLELFEEHVIQRHHNACVLSGSSSSLCNPSKTKKPVGGHRWDLKSESLEFLAPIAK